MRNFVTLTIIGLTYFSLGSTQDTIKKLQVIFRHGYRYPTSLVWTENDTCAELYDTLKLGNLTNLGRSQMRLLGYFLRIHYNNLIGDDARKIQVNYSDSNRDKESAELVYQALFEDFDNKTVIKDLVGVLNKTIEGKLATNNTYYTSWLESIPWSERLKEQCNNLNQIQNLSCENRRQFHKFSGQMICELAEDCTLPPWLGPQVKENLIEDFKETYGAFQLCSSQQFIKDNSDEMLKWMNEIFNPENEDSYVNVHLYASHDTNIGVILTRMGVFNSLPVPFGAALAFEQHLIGDKRIIRLFYDNSTDYSNFYKLKLPGCDWDCPYDNFVEIVTGPYPCASCLRLCSEASSLVFIVTCSYIVSWLLR